MKYFFVILLSSCTLIVFGQKTIIGTITDEETLAPIIGATVSAAGSRNATISDYNGKFILTLDENQRALEISYIGYTTKQVTDIDKSAELYITLTPGALLDEIIVVGYTSQLKKDLTGAVSVVKLDEIGQVPYANILQSLQGRVAGINLTQDGQPGSGRTQVRVRGFTSFNNSDPLVVVDGIATQEPLDNINANDIESIQVLKDASASIYGSRSAAGVIIVTTKKGKNGKLSIEAGSSLGYQTILNKIELLDASQWGEVYWAASKNTNPNKIPQFTGYFDVGGKPVTLLDPQFYDLSVKDQTYQYTPSGTDWYDQVYQNALTQNYHINMSNGSEKGSIMFGASYLSQAGTIKTTFYDRVTARLNSNYNITNWIHLFENLSVSNSNRLGVSSQTDQGGIPFDVIRQHPAHPVYDTEGNFAGRVGSFPDVRNSVSRLENGKNNTTDSWRVFGNVGLSADILKGFGIDQGNHSVKLSTNFGIDYSNFFSQNFQSSIYEGVYQIAQNSLYNVFGDGITKTINNLLEYNFTNEHHRIKISGGIESVSYKFRDLSAGRFGYVVEVPSYVTIGSGAEIAGNNGTRNNWGLLSEFGRLDYTLSDRYLVSAIYRHDRTSRFQTDGSFPTIMLGWRLTEESFFKNRFNQTGMFSDIKLRASYGKLGNQNTTDTPYAAFSTFGPQALNSNYDIFSTNNSVVQGFSVINRGNPFLKWETTTQINIGLDLGLWKDKITLSIDAYNKITEDLLDNPPSILAVGEGTAPYVNLAKVSNKGIELTINHQQKTLNSGFGLSNSLQISVYRNKIIELKEIYPLGYEGERYTNKEVRIAEGKQLGEFYGWIHEGIFQSQAEVDAHPKQQGKAIGRLKFKDVNGDGTVDQLDRTYIGSPHPKLSLGLNTSITYKQLYADIFWYASVGNKIFNTTKWITDFAQNGTYNRRTAILDAWTPENTSATIPMLTLDDGGNDEGRASTYYVEDGSFLKLRTLRVGYSLPEKIVTGVNISFYGEVQNAFTFTKYSGVDPEVPQTFRNGIGIDAGVYPLPRIFMFGINLKL